MVRQGARLADIGTDHAYLPIWLAKRRRIRGAVACDVRPGPLDRARRNILRYGAQDLVSARLSDGLDFVLPAEAEDVVIAGMGGLMMISILERAPWLREEDRRLILQPMTSEPELRSYLAGEGYAVLAERAASEDGHVYAVMQATFRPRDCRYGELFPYIGRVAPETPEGRDYLRLQMRRLQKRAGGFAHCGRTGEADRYARLAREIGSLLSGEERENVP